MAFVYLSVDLAAISFKVDHVRYDDLFNVPADKMGTLTMAIAGKKVVVTLSKDNGDDDGHPQLVDAQIL